MVAHATFGIPEEVITKGMVASEWWLLSGKEGPDKEGRVHLTFSLQTLPTGGGTTTKHT